MENKVDFVAEMGAFNFINKYAKYNEKYNRRETWDECVNRSYKMHHNKFKSKLSKEDLDEIKWAFDQVQNKLLVPSMRSMQFGGKAAEAVNARLYNCCVRHIDSIRAFAELFYSLLCGNGIGIGVSQKYISRFPDLVNASNKTGIVINYVVEDSIAGWADSVEALLNCYFKNTAYTGRKLVFDYSRIREEGAPLKTSGGKAPGYKGLKNCHRKIKELFDYIIEEKHQTRLLPINAYDIVMHCADATLSGGIRRSACSCIFDITDKDMLTAKTFFTVTKHTRFAFDEDSNLYCGKVTVNRKVYDVEISEYEYNELKTNKLISWIHIEPQRARSNNSVLLLRDTVTFEEFLEINKMTKQFGEPGFVFANHPDTLFNPCFEIGFIPITKDGRCGIQMCNLTSINGAKCDTFEKFLTAVKAATIIGTLQASFTDFGYLGKASQELTEEEALLGVSIAGLMDNPDVLLKDKYLREGAKLAKEINEEWAKKIGINPAARITCNKPDGNTSVTLGCAPGVHAHHARRSFRRIQCNKQDNIYKFFKKINPHLCEPSVWSANKTDDVITFPITVSDKAIIKSDLTALEHLNIIKKVQTNWVLPGTTDANKKDVTHNVSCTVIVKDDEWDVVFKYLYDNRNYFAAVSLLPFIGDKLYKQAPMEAVTTEQDEELWKKLVENYTPVDYKKLNESEDNTHMTQEIACAGGACTL